MAVGRFLMLPSFVIFLAYIGTLVAVVDRHSIADDKVLYKTCNYETENCHHEDDLFKFEALSSVLANTDSFSNTVDVLTKLASAIPVTFDPPSVLDFREQPIGMPKSHVVKLINPSNSLTLQLISLSGSKSEFHTSFFVNKILRPGESTSFDVMFLARNIGAVDDIITIHSSLGMFEYKVSGVGISNPFRLRSFFGARIPFNATYQPAITIYNPYNDPLQILEVYSTDKDLQLELPSGTLMGNKSVWDVRPYETKTIARVNFHGHQIENYTSFIRIKTNHITQPSLIIPFDVEVCEPVGLFVSKEIFDFGIVRTDTESKLSLLMLNAGPNVIEIKSITAIDNPAIKIAITNTTLKPSLRYVKVAVLTYSGAHATGKDLKRGLIKIWAEDIMTFYQTLVPYVAEVMRGSLDYDYQQTLFQAHAPPFVPVVRELKLTNRFQYPVAIYSAKLNTKFQDWFSLHSFESPYILPADGKNYSVLLLKFTIQSSDCFFNTTLRLATNTSFFNIPLQCYDGRLHYDFGGRDIDALEFGTLSHLDSGSKLVTITNRNPVKVSIQSITIHEIKDLPFLSIYALELPPPDPNEKPVILKDGFRKGRRPPHDMKPGQYCVFRINITTPTRPGKFSGEILLHSSMGKVVTVPVNYIAVKGFIRFVPRKFRLSTAFLHSPTSIHLYLKSTYTNPVKLVSLVIESSNTSSNHSLPVLLPKKLTFTKSSTTTMIGDLVLDPLLFYKNPLPVVNLINIKDNVRKRITDDISTLERLWEAWQKIVSEGMSYFSFRLKVLTEMNEEVFATVDGSVLWPRIPRSDSLNFPLTLIGNHSVLNITLHNPSDHSIHIEPLLLTQEIDTTHSILSLLSDVYSTDLTSYNQSATNVYSIVPYNFSLFDSIPRPPLKFVLRPHRRETLSIIFSPKQDLQTNTLLLLRNNLTVFDYVKLSGTGTPGFITIDGIHPHGGQPLLFEFTQSFMEGYLVGIECGMSSRDLLSYSKVFHVRNSGSKPVNIKRTSIDSQGCERNGFRVTNCEKSMIVYPNRTRKIEVFCIPDFTLSRITSTLQLHFSDGTSLDFPVLATLPHHMLPSCYSAVPRTKSEELADYLSGPLWVITLLIMVVVTFFQVKWHYRRIDQLSVSHSSISHVVAPPNVVGKDVPVQPTGGSTFDLSDLTHMVQNTISSRVEELRKSVEKEQANRVEKLSSLSSESLRGHTPLVEEERLKPIPVGQDPVPSDRLIESVVKTITTDHHTGIRHESNISFVNNKPVRSPPDDPEPHPHDATHPPRKSKGGKRAQAKHSDTKPVLATPEASTSGPVTPSSSSDIKLDQFQRKESDESIKSVESDLTSPCTSSCSPDIDDGSHSLDLTPSFSEGTKQKPSYAKEPLTGQTVEVREDTRNGDTEPNQPSPPLSARSSALSKAAKIGKKKKVHPHKREEKSRKKQQQQLQREKYIEQSVSFKTKKNLGSQESLDKESVASNSTNSTDNMEDETVEVTNTEESTKTSEGLAESESKKEIEGALPLEEEDGNCVMDDHSVVVKSESNTSEVERSGNMEESVVLAEKKPEVFLSAENESSNAKAETEAAEDKDIIESQASPPSPPTDRSSSTKSRPKKLDLETPKGEPESNVSSAEVDGTSEKRLAPHELASSLLTNRDIIVRRGGGKSKTISPSKSSDDVTVPKGGNIKKKLSHENIDKRSQLSHEALPFYPGYSPHQYPLPHPMPHPVPPHPPILPHLHRMASPPYDYRHYGEDYYHLEQVYEAGRHHRKLSEHQKPQKPYAPPMPHPYYSQESHYRERPRPRVYDHSEWVGPSAPEPGYYDDASSAYYSKHRMEMGPSRPSGYISWRGQPQKRSTFESKHIPETSEYFELSEDPVVYQQRQLQMDKQQQLLDMEHSRIARERSYWGREGRHYQELEAERFQQQKLYQEKWKHSEESNRGLEFSGRSLDKPSELSLLLSQSSATGWGSSLNKAPGSQPNQTSNLASLFDSSHGIDWSHGADDKDDSSTCKRLWSMNSPLSNALEEQRLKAAAQLSAPSPPPPSSLSFGEKNQTETSNYELFESDIWGFGTSSSGESIFPWDNRYSKR